MSAPQRFVAWMAGYTYPDRKKKLPPGLAIQYHGRSDEHSKQLARLIVADLIATCPVIREQAARGDIAFGINYKYAFQNGKQKTLDLAIGMPSRPLAPPPPGVMHEAKNKRKNESTRNPSVQIRRLLFCCELKAVMTEHGKSQPRVYSELNDAHAIPHAGSSDIIATGATTINAATTFVSATRITPGMTKDQVEITTHVQPHVTERMIEHLRGLPLRRGFGVGLDARTAIVVDADNQGHVALVTAPPAPQPGEPDHYDAFLQTICAAWTERFADLTQLPPENAQTLAETLVALGRAHPFSLARIGALGVAAAVPGAPEIEAVLQVLDREAGNVPKDPEDDDVDEED